MSRLFRFAGALAAFVACAATVAYFTALAGLNRPQPFYERALASPPQELAAAKETFEAQVEQLAAAPVQADVQLVVFTAAEVNGWLAEALVNEYQDLLPESVSDVRAAFVADKCLIGFRYTTPKLTTLVSAEVTASVDDANVARVAFLDLRAGQFRLPLDTIREPLEEVFAKLEAAIKWSEDADQLAVEFSLDRLLTFGGVRRELRKIRLLDDRAEIAWRASDPGAPRLAQKQTAENAAGR